MKRDKALKFFRNEIEEIECDANVPLEWMEDFKAAFAALESEEVVAEIEGWMTTKGACRGRVRLKGPNVISGMIHGERGKDRIPVRVRILAVKEEP